MYEGRKVFQAVRKGAIMNNILFFLTPKAMCAFVYDDYTVRQALELTPPELSADIADLGIAMTGGGSMLRGLDIAIRAATGLPVFLVDNPLACVACGSGKMLSNLDKNKHVLQTMY